MKLNLMLLKMYCLISAIGNAFVAVCQEHKLLGQIGSQNTRIVGRNDHRHFSAAIEHNGMPIVFDVQDEFIAAEVDFHSNLLGAHQLEQIIHLGLMGDVYPVANAISACFTHRCVDVPVQVFWFDQT